MSPQPWKILPLLLLAAPLAAQPFPELTDAERTLTEAPGFPDAPAVVLRKHAELRLAGSQSSAATTLEVFVRTKILTESGKSLGEVVVGHSSGVRLERFEGRTTTADGREIPLTENAVFTERGSETGRSFLTKAAFPAVEVGAVIDYRFRLQWRSAYVEPFSLEETVPTLLAELVYHVPRGMEAAHYVRGPAEVGSQSDKTADGSVVRLFAENLPPALEEPYSFPKNDLVTRIFVVPRFETAPDGTRVPLFDSWTTVCRSYESLYDGVRKRRRQVKRTALETVGSERRADRRASLLQAWVRDEIATRGEGLKPEPGATLDGVLAESRGGAAEKALLLQAMLESLKIPARLLWAVDWRDGFADLDIVNPGWFDKVLVLASIGDRPLILDPSDRRLPAGKVSPVYEGAQALVVDREKPEVVELKASGPDSSVRRVELALTAGDDGRFAGRGRLSLTGHHAWFYLRRVENEAANASAWKQWLEERFDGFEANDTTVDEDVDHQRITVTFTLLQHEEDVLADEASYKPSRPFGPARQRYTLPPEERRQAVQVSFADRDEVELVVRWGEDWKVDAAPAPFEASSEAGTAKAEVGIDEAGHRIVYRRTLEIARTRYDVGEPYRQLRDLYTQLERHDAESIVLVRE